MKTSIDRCVKCGENLKDVNYNDKNYKVCFNCNLAYPLEMVGVYQFQIVTTFEVIE